MANMRWAWVQVAATYIASVIGAGFASGRELWQFFGRYGSPGIWGLLVAGILFWLGGYLALEHGRRGVTTVESLMRTIFPPTLSIWVDRLSGVFLWVGLAVVVAGGGAVGHAMWNWPVLIGQALTIGLIVLIVAGGVTRVMVANAYLVPYLIVLAMLVALLGSPPVGHSVMPAHGLGGWLLSALLYVSYNIFTGVVVLLNVGPTLGNRQGSFMAAGMATLVLTGVGWIELRTIGVRGGIDALPMLTAANMVHSVLGKLYGLSLWVALLTTGVAEAYILRSRYGNSVYAGMAGIPILASVGFEELVATAYPIMGILSAVLWIPLTLSYPRSKSSSSRR